MEKNKKQNIVSLLLVGLGSILWRMGGAASFSKLWRRLGVPLCALGILSVSVDFIWWKACIAVFLWIWGSCSYFGWINKLLKKNCDKCLAVGTAYGAETHKDCRYFNSDILGCNLDSEFWYNFYVEAFVMLSVLFLYTGEIVFTSGVVCLFSSLAAFGKVFIDDSNFNKKDVVSELYFGGMVLFGLYFGLNIFTKILN